MKFSDFILNEATQRDFVIDDQVLAKKIEELIRNKTIWRLADKSKNAYDFKFFKDNVGIIEDLGDAYGAKGVEKGERTTFAITTPGGWVLRFQSSGSKSGASGNDSRGHKLEKSLVGRINACVGLNINEVQDDVVRRIMVEAGFKQLTKPAVARGAENSKRKIDITQSTNNNIGDTISDVDIFGLVGSKEVRVPISVKYGPMISYINRGAGDFFEKIDHKNREITKPAGINLFKALGLAEDDEARELYFDIFNNFKEAKESGNSGTKFITMSGFDKTMLANIAANAIGYGYILVHENPTGNFRIEKIDKAYLNNYKNVNKVVGKFKFGIKRVDFLVYYGQKKLAIVIRNKQGGVYPSHVMVDWKADNYNFKGND